MLYIFFLTKKINTEKKKKKKKKDPSPKTTNNTHTHTLSLSHTHTQTPSLSLSLFSLSLTQHTHTTHTHTLSLSLSLSHKTHHHQQQQKEEGEKTYWKAHFSILLFVQHIHKQTFKTATNTSPIHTQHLVSRPFPDWSQPLRHPKQLSPQQERVRFLLFSHAQTMAYCSYSSSRTLNIIVAKSALHLDSPRLLHTKPPTKTRKVAQTLKTWNQAAIRPRPS